VLPYEQDGVRPADQHQQLRYQILIEGLLRRYLDPHKLHLLPETLMRLEDRQRWIAARLARTSQTADVARGGRMPGCVYLVGAGPGDPKLLTLRAAELLRQADVVAYDLLLSPELLAQIPASAELLPVGRRNGMSSTDYRLHPAVMARAREGKGIVRLKSGDPLLFGRGGEEAEELRQAGIPFEIVPGITAALGAAAYAGIPLTHRGKASEVLLSTGHQAQNTSYGDSNGSKLSSSRTIVLYMAARRLQASLDRLCADGYAPATSAALVASATTPRQQVFLGTLGTLAQRIPALPSEVPAILIVGDVVSLRKNVHWFQTDQLRHRRIVVARARPGESQIAASLRMLSAEVIESPFISSQTLADHSQLDAALAQSGSYDAVVFGSEPGVHALSHWLKHPQCGAADSIVCIGEQAGKALLSYGINPVAILHGSCAKALWEQVDLFAGRRLLLITSCEGRPQLVRELTALGAQVNTVSAYQVTRRFEEDLFGGDSVDLVVLPSSTAAHHLLTHSAAASLRHTPMIAIGPQTEALALRCGATNVLCAPHDDVEAVVSSVLQLLAPGTHSLREMRQRA
jgi:uroporphyrinogen III methyltransferase/synthase